MNFDDLKEKLIENLRAAWAKIEDSSTYAQFMEKYEELSPQAQKGVQIGAVALAAMLVLSIPMSYLSTASENLASFEEVRELTRDLLKTERKARNLPDYGQGVAGDALRSRIESIIDQAKVQPDQKSNLDSFSASSPAETRMIPKGVTQTGFAVTIKKLNLKQIADISRGLDTIDSSVRIWSFSMEPNAQDAKYFDVVFQVLGFSVPVSEASAAAPASGGRGRFRKRSGSGDF